MDKKRNDDPKTYPWLGRLMLGIDSPETGSKLLIGLGVICAILFGLDFTYKKYGHFEIESMPGAFAALGFIIFGFIILASSALRKEIHRPEDYYGDKAVDSEEYPDEGLEKLHNDD